jgi:hypothetical protein
VTVIFNSPPVLIPGDGSTIDFYVGEIKNIIANDQEEAPLTLNF